MRKPFALFVALLTIVSFVQFAGASPDDKLSKSDKDVIKDTMRNLQSISDQSRLARESDNEHIAHFAREVVGGDNKLVDQIRELGNKYGFAYDANPSKPDARDTKDLDKEKGKKFDREYADLMVKQHEELLGLFKKGSQSDNKDVASWFDKKQEVVRDYLDQAKKLQHQLND